MAKVNSAFLKNEIERRKTELAALESLEGLLANPTLAAIAREMLGVNGEMSDSFPDKKPGGKSFEKVEKFFAECGNTPATIAEMAKAADVSPSMIRQLIYKTQKSAFEKAGTNDNRQALYRMVYAE